MIGTFLGRTGTGLVAATVLLAGVWGGTTALAQYPPPGPGVTITPSSTNATLGGTLTLTLTMVDTAGKPVANRTCDISIKSQPGSDASVVAGSSATDASGVIKATLKVGSRAGNVVVSADCGGVLGSAVVPVTGGVGLPSTGVGAAGGTNAALPLSVLAVGALLALTGAAVARQRRRSAS